MCAKASCPRTKPGWAKSSDPNERPPSRENQRVSTPCGLAGKTVWAKITGTSSQKSTTSRTQQRAPGASPSASHSSALARYRCCRSRWMRKRPRPCSRAVREPGSRSQLRKARSPSPLGRSPRQRENLMAKMRSACRWQAANAADDCTGLEALGLEPASIHFQGKPCGAYRAVIVFSFRQHFVDIDDLSLLVEEGD